MKKWVDLPPVWLLFFLILAWGLARLVPQWNVAFAGQGWLAAGLAAAGVALFALAVREMFGARTTVMPRERPSALVSTGVFRLSRNPIYLADTLFLLAWVIWLGNPAGLLLVPLFMRLIARRFIEGEEAALRAEFGEEFEAWARRTRRWI